MDPLDTLFVKGDEVNRELLRDVLTPYVRLDEKGRVFPLTAFYSQTNKNKVIILLLSRKAVALKTGISEEVSPVELSKLSDIPEGSLRPTLRLLVDEHLVDDEDSKYAIFSHAVRRCAELLVQKADNAGNDAPQASKTNGTRISMRGVIEDLIRQGGLDSGKTANEIQQMVLQRRPGTARNPLYKVILDLVHEQKLTRGIKDGIWMYRRAD